MKETTKPALTGQSDPSEPLAFLILRGQEVERSQHVFNPAGYQKLQDLAADHVPLSTAAQECFHAVDTDGMTCLTHLLPLPKGGWLVCAYPIGTRLVTAQALSMRFLASHDLFSNHEIHPVMTDLRLRSPHSSGDNLSWQDELLAPVSETFSIASDQSPETTTPDTDATRPVVIHKPIESKKKDAENIEVAEAPWPYWYQVF